jgi:hypothetical protein
MRALNQTVKLAWAMGAVLAMSGARADEPAPSHVLELRAIQPLPSDALQVIATYGTPTVLSKINYPDAGKFSAKKIIDVLCGSYREELWIATQRLNGGLAGVRATDRIRDRVYKIKWPACTYVIQPTKAVPLLVYNKTTASDLYKQLTGGVGNDTSIRYYFRNSGVSDVAKIAAGTALVPAHVTVAGQLKFTNPTGFTQALTSAMPGDPAKYIKFTEVVGQVPNGAPPAPAAPVGKTKFSIAIGRTEAVANKPYENPAECQSITSPDPVFNVSRVLAAYDIARRAQRRLMVPKYPIDVFVADNGFFGAKGDASTSKVDFGPEFPEEFFYTAFYKEGKVGPPITLDDLTKIFPLNSANGLDHADYVSGHGTHVVGLVLGGPSFHDHLDVFRQKDDLPWLHVIVLNIGNGGEYLLRGSERLLDSQVELLRNKIINVSLEYVAGANESLEPLFTKMFTAGEVNQNLFVVSAGNDSENVANRPYFPAVFGGGKLGLKSSIITVAAHRPDGSLAAFSNRGQKNVDIAAPGCNIDSWIDDSARSMQVSGTSQAAAIVTFAAAMVRTMGNIAPHLIKLRLMTSGDLLTIRAPSDNDPAANPSPGQIMSRSRLNIATALYVFDDYVRYRLKGDAKVHEVLGSVDDLYGVHCDSESNDVDLADVWAFKAQSPAAWLYSGKKMVDTAEPCKAVLSKGASISVHIRVALAEDGTPMLEKDLPAAATTTIPLGSVEEYVAALPRTTP